VDLPSRLLGPGLVGSAGQQLAGAARRDLRARGAVGVGVAQCGFGVAQEVRDVGRHAALREQLDAPGAQDDRLGVLERAGRRGARGLPRGGRVLTTGEGDRHAAVGPRLGLAEHALRRWDRADVQRKLAERLGRHGRHAGVLRARTDIAPGSTRSCREQPPDAQGADIAPGAS